LWRGLFICMNFERSEALQGEQSRRWSVDEYVGSVENNRYLQDL
jgi:hypothetical protein